MACGLQACARGKLGTVVPALHSWPAEGEEGGWRDGHATDSTHSRGPMIALHSLRADIDEMKRNGGRNCQVEQCYVLGRIAPAARSTVYSNYSTLPFVHFTQRSADQHWVVVCSYCQSRCVTAVSRPYSQAAPTGRAQPAICLSVSQKCCQNASSPAGICQYRRSLVATRQVCHSLPGARVASISRAPVTSSRSATRSRKLIPRCPPLM